LALFVDSCWFDCEVASRWWGLDAALGLESGVVCVLEEL
jgi:hypothetical protein